MRLAGLILCAMLLTGCGTSKIVYKCDVPEVPKAPTYYHPQFDDKYCLTEEGARQLLKNKALNDDYIRQLLLILKGLK